MRRRGPSDDDALVIRAVMSKHRSVPVRFAMRCSSHCLPLTAMSPWGSSSMPAESCTFHKSNHRSQPAAAPPRLTAAFGCWPAAVPPALRLASCRCVFAFERHAQVAPLPVDFACGFCSCHAASDQRSKRKYDDSQLPKATYDFAILQP